MNKKIHSKCRLENGGHNKTGYIDLLTSTFAAQGPLLLTWVDYNPPCISNHMLSSV